MPELDMGNLIARMAVLGAMLASLTACQSVKVIQVQNIKESESTQKNARIYCAGTENCHFERLDQTVIMKEISVLDREAIKAGVVRMQANSLKDPNPIYLSVEPGQHELVISFYPISTDKAERLHVIHAFKPHTAYTFYMFRDRRKQKASLLDASVPNPLCVDLKVERKTIRRFCKPYNVLNGLGEFAEKKLK